MYIKKDFRFVFFLKRKKNDFLYSMNSGHLFIWRILHTLVFNKTMKRENRKQINIQYLKYIYFFYKWRITTSGTNWMACFQIKITSLKHWSEKKAIFNTFSPAILPENTRMYYFLSHSYCDINRVTTNPGLPYILSCSVAFYCIQLVLNNLVISLCSQLCW